MATLFDRPAARLRPVPVPVLVNPSLTLGSLDLDHLAQHGFCKPPTQFLSDAGLEFCRENIDRMIGALAASQPGRTPDRMVNQHQCEGGEWLWDLVSHPMLVAAAQRQIGEDVLCWSTHLLIKEPGTGAAIPWHQDAPYWNMFGDMSAAVCEKPPDRATCALYQKHHRASLEVHYPSRTRPAAPMATQTDPILKGADNTSAAVRDRAGRCGQL